VLRELSYVEPGYYWDWWSPLGVDHSCSFQAA